MTEEAPPYGDDLSYGDPLCDLAFRRLYEVAEHLKAEGASTVDAWRVIFNITQDLQAGDLGMGSEEHRQEVQAQCESLSNALETWDDPVETGAH